jgi:predicted transcriptional regulator
MNPIQIVAKTKISYSGTANSILKYMSMKNRMGDSTVTADEIMKFFPHKIPRRDTLLRTLNTMKKNGFIKQNNNGYMITNIGKQVPFIVASIYMKKLTQSGKRTNYAHDWED